MTEPEAGRKEGEPPAAPPSAPAGPGGGGTPGARGPCGWEGLSWGIELCVSVLLFTWLGHWLDRRWETEPWLTLLGALAGFGLGLYLVLRGAARHERRR